MTKMAQRLHLSWRTGEPELLEGHLPALRRCFSAAWNLGPNGWAFVARRPIQSKATEEGRSAPAIAPLFHSCKPSFRSENTRRKLWAASRCFGPCPSVRKTQHAVGCLRHDGLLDNFSHAHGDQLPVNDRSNAFCPCWEAMECDVGCASVQLFLLTTCLNLSLSEACLPRRWLQGSSLSTRKSPKYAAAAPPRSICSTKVARALRAAFCLFRKHVARVVASR